MLIEQASSRLDLDWRSAIWEEVTKGRALQRIRAKANVTRRFFGTVKELGVAAALLYGIDRVLMRLSPGMRLYVYELMVQPIVDKPLLPARMARNFESRQITRGDPELELMPAQADIRQSRFDQNAICLGAFFKGQLIGYIWFCFREYEEDEVRCTFLLRPENEAVFDFDLFVLPEHRMGFGFAGIWNAANEFLRKRGARFTFSRVTRFNLATRSAHRRLGAKVAARAIFLKLWGVELMFATIAPYVHLSIAKSQRVHLQLRPDVLLILIAIVRLQASEPWLLEHACSTT